MNINDKIDVYIRIVTADDGNFYILKDSKILIPLNYKQAVFLLNAQDDHGIYNQIKPADVAYDMYENLKYNELVNTRLVSFESEDNVRELSKQIKESFRKIRVEMKHPETIELQEDFEKLKSNLEILRNAYNMSDIDEEKEILNTKIKDVETEIQRLEKTLNKFGSFNLPLGIKTPTVKIKEHSLDSVFKNVDICDYNEYEKLWNDLVNYGPVAATLIYLGCLENKIPMFALKKTWIEIKKTIESHQPKHFSEIYKLMVDQTYQYCSNQYNFLVGFYERGICNCECGSFLTFMMTKLNAIITQHTIKATSLKILDTTQTIPVTFAIVVPRHILILESNVASKRMLMNLNSWYEFETTIPGGLRTHITDENKAQMKFAIFTEQIMALYIIVQSMRMDRKSHEPILGKMLGVDFLAMSFEEIMQKADRRAVKSPLESNTFDILLCIACYKSFKIQDECLDIIYDLNRKYIEEDMLKVAISNLKGVNFPKEILENRATAFRQKLIEIVRNKEASTME
jgi:hypothetical protein